MTPEGRSIATLASHLGPRGRTRLTPKEYWRVAAAAEDSGLRIHQLRNRDDVAEIVGSLGPKVEAALAEEAAVVSDVSSYETFGIHTLTVVDDEFPESLPAALGSSTPPVLHAAGPLDSTSGTLLGVVGSRDVTEAGAQVARSVGTECARRGIVVVSGAARGVDSLAMNATVQGGGRSIGVLADSLERRVDRSTEGLGLLTSYHPRAGFSAGRAMGRNKIIYGLSRAVLVIASGESGGTWSGAQEALKSGYATVLVWVGDGAGPGNEALVRHGGTPVTSVDGVFDHLSESPTRTAQSKLF